jgi:YqjK-like protein
MNPRLIELAERRAVLIEKAATQRAELSREFAPWRGPLAIADQGLRVMDYLKRHPALLIGATLITAVLRPRRSARWLRRGWLLWSLATRVKRGLLGI